LASRVAITFFFRRTGGACTALLIFLLTIRSLFVVCRRIRRKEAISPHTSLALGLEEERAHRGTRWCSEALAPLSLSRPGPHSSTDRTAVGKWRVTDSCRPPWRHLRGLALSGAGQPGGSTPTPGGQLDMARVVLVLAPPAPAYHLCRLCAQHPQHVSLAPFQRDPIFPRSTRASCSDWLSTVVGCEAWLGWASTMPTN